MNTLITEALWIVSFVAEAVWRVWPAFLISIGLGVAVRAFKFDRLINRAFNQRIGLAILLAVAVGAFSPFCSCTVVPVISAMLLAGVPLAPVMAFWIASPTMDPEIFALSVATLGWPLAVARLIATLALSLAAGYLTLALTRAGVFASGVLRQDKQALLAQQPPTPASTIPSAVIQPALIPVMSLAAPAPALTLTPAAVSAAGGAPCTAETCGPVRAAAAPHVRRAASLWESIKTLEWKRGGARFVEQIWQLGRWLLLAFVLEALITRYVPQQAIAEMLGGQSLFAVPLASLIGVPLYLNNVSALPIVSGLLAKGMQPGAAIAFLLAGPVTTFPAMTAVWGIAQKRVFALYLGISLIGSIVLGYAANLILS